MSPPAGMLTEAELRDLVGRGEIDTVLVVFPDLYGRLVGKRYDAGFFCSQAIAHGMHACDYLLACDMEMDPVPGYRFTSWQKGYGDVRCMPERIGSMSWRFDIIPGLGRGGGRVPDRPMTLRARGARHGQGCRGPGQRPCRSVAVSGRAPRGERRAHAGGRAAAGAARGELWSAGAQFASRHSQLG